MEFKFATSILFSNMGYVVKILVWILICVLLTAAVGAAILIPMYDTLAERSDIEQDFASIKDAIDRFIGSDERVSIKATVTAVFGSLGHAVETFASDAGLMTGLVFALIFLYMLYCFMSGILYYPVSHIINNIMSSNLRFGLASNIALNFKLAVRYSASRLIIALPIDIVIAAVMFGLAYGLIYAISVFAMPILIVTGILLVTLRSLLFSGWLPRTLYHPEEKIYMAFSRSLVTVKLNFKGLFKAYLLTFILSYLMITAFTLPTFGLINLFVPSIYYFLLRTVELVGYYKIKGFSFYTDASTVINTVEFGYRVDNQNSLEDAR